MARALKTGEVIDGRYEIIGLLGVGSAAHVYRAHDRDADRQVAIKVMRVRLAGDRAARQRFDREAELQAKVVHRDVAAIYGSGVTRHKRPYLALELLHGRSLRDVIRREGAVEVSSAASYCWQALQGLTALHDSGVIHRDIKPGNLMLEPSPGPIERVVLIDFGFASLEGGGGITATGHVVGSLGYLAPERLLGAVADARSDIYSVGVVLFELICGRRPFVADHDLALVDAHLKEPIPRLAEVNPDLDAGDVGDIEAIIHKAMDKDPTARFASTTEMADALGGAAQP